MDGWAFLNHIKQIDALRHVPVVIISIVADSTRGFTLGAAAVLQKPISRYELQDSLADLGLNPALDKPITVLIVDDEPDAVEIVANHLADPLYTIVRAHGGSAAINLVRQTLPDLIIMDLMMPDVSGFDVVEALKLSPDTAHIPILVVTAKHLTLEERELLNGHVTRIMAKAEFNHGRFIGEVKRALAFRDRG